VIDLTADATVVDIDSLDFAILSGADANKFTLKGNSSEGYSSESMSPTVTSVVRLITLAVFSGVKI
jgi:hypothetical protein